MYYADILAAAGPDRRRVAERLLALRNALRAAVPPKRVDDHLLLATWNLREFGGSKGGGRSVEAMAYIAEIVSHFDLVAVQEVRADLGGLDALRRLLGPWWKAVYTDVTAGRSGNGERLCFLYDTRVVTFDGLAGEIVLPDGADGRALQFARSPFSCGFRAGWKRLELSTVHIYYGKGVSEDPRRVEEIDRLAKFLAKRGRELDAPGDAHLVVLGDFNIFNRDDATFERLSAAGFVVPEPLQQIPGSNVDRTKHYDQIAFLGRRDGLGVAHAGVFDPYEHVFRDDRDGGVSDAEHFDPGRMSFRTWRTYQLSDHLPMWACLDVGAADAYLAAAAKEPRKRGKSGAARGKDRSVPV
jgi:hypothetical protein